MEKEYVIIAGYFASGSSAVVDLLKEFRGFHECGAEIRIIKDPYGIKQLERALIDDWDIITSSAAISDFMEISRKWSRKGGGRNIIAPAGLNYRDKINHNYMQITSDYVSRLVQYTYIGDYYHYKFKKKYLNYVLDRGRIVVEHLSKGKFKAANRKTPICYFAKPSREQFINTTKEYFDELFLPFFKTGKFDHVILDQAVSPRDAKLVEKYFTKAKIIIVDRDPRDMFADDLENVMSFRGDSLQQAKVYIAKQKAMRENLPVSNQNIMYVRFEELVLNYEQELARIMRFLGVKQQDHINKKKYLKPEISSKNVGIWKRHYHECPDVFDLIYEEIQEWCYKE